MKQIIKSKKTWRWLGVISAFLFLDLMIIGPTLKVNTQGKVERINQLIDRYTPIYTGSKGRSLYSLRSGYFYKLELEDDISISPHPRDVSEGTFMGYGVPGRTKIKVMLYAEDPSYRPGKFTEKVRSWPISPGTKTFTLQGKGSLSSHEIQITVRVEEIDIDMKIVEPGYLWNTYGPAKGYYVNLDVKKIRVVEVYKAG